MSDTDPRVERARTCPLPGALLRDLLAAYDELDALRRGALRAHKKTLAVMEEACYRADTLAASTRDREAAAWDQCRDTLAKWSVFDIYGPSPAPTNPYRERNSDDDH